MAPSPTGWLHVGTARATLFNYLFARNQKGAFILRIEDTDLERSSPEYEKDILESLAWLGLGWDEFYRQSERLDIYEKYIKQLLEEGKAFYCTHTQEELKEERSEHMAARQAPRHVCSQRNSLIEADLQPQGIIRLRNDAAGPLIFTDIIRGEISINAETLGDFSLAKDTRAPLYNLAVVIDDKEMEITHVIRGEDHISNTPKQLLIQQSLGFPQPRYAHLPLILGPDRSKLSKRHGTTALREYKEQGYLPEAMINFMALLGWNPGGRRELFTLRELEEEFSLENVQKSSAVFNIEKLQSMNGIYIRNLSAHALRERAERHLPKTAKTFPPEYVERVLALEQSRLKTLDEIREKTVFFFQEPAYEPALLQWKNKQDPRDIINNLEAVGRTATDIPLEDWTEEKLRAAIMPLADERGRGEVLWPLRVALTGKEASPDPIEIAAVLGKKTVLRRIKKAKELAAQNSNT